MALSARPSHRDSRKRRHRPRRHADRERKIRSPYRPRHRDRRRTDRRWGNAPNCRRSTRREGNWPLGRSEEHTSELQSLMRISYAVFCLTKTTRITIYKYIFIQNFSTKIVLLASIV